MGFGAKPASARHVSGTDTWMQDRQLPADLRYLRGRAAAWSARRANRAPRRPRSAARASNCSPRWCSDGNRSYWDAEFARQKMGRAAGPAGLADGMADTPAVGAAPTRKCQAAGGIDGAAGAVAGHHIHQRGQRRRVLAAHRRGRSAHRRRGAGVGVAGKADPAGRRSFRRNAGDLSPPRRGGGRHVPKYLVQVHTWSDPRDR